MSDTFVFRLMLVVIAIVILFALVAQYNKQKSAQEDDAKRVVAPTAAPAHVPHAHAHALAPETYRPSPSSAARQHLGAPVATVEGFQQPQSASSRLGVVPPPAPPLAKLVNADPAPFESLDTEMYRAMDYKPQDNSKPQPDAFPKDRLTKDDLLPKDAADTKWAQVNPAGQGDLENVNLLDAGWNYGIDTQGQTLKNPNLQIRSEFPNPRADIGPWNQSTIENDCSRRYFEIGEP